MPVILSPPRGGDCQWTVRRHSSTILVEIDRGPYRQKQTHTLHETVHPLANPEVLPRLQTASASS